VFFAILSHLSFPKWETQANEISLLKIKSLPLPFGQMVFYKLLKRNHFICIGIVLSVRWLKMKYECAEIVLFSKN
jgi:hypothetical protein